MDPELIPKWVEELQAQRFNHRQTVANNREEISNLKRKLDSLKSVKNDMEQDDKDTSLLRSEFIDKYQNELNRLESENTRHIKMSETIDSIIENI